MSKGTPGAFRQTRNIRESVTFRSPEEAAATGVGVDIFCWLAHLGHTGKQCCEKVLELDGDIANLILGGSKKAMLLVFDGHAVRLHVSADDAKLADIETRETSSGHSVFGVVPLGFLNWARENGCYARAH